jgi:chaperonin cofactor prefoldin
VIYLVVVNICHALLLALEITIYVMEDNFDTLGVDKAIYGYYYSRANYHNTKQYNMWNEKALNAIRLNMKDQHTEMKRQLQERHKDIANHVGQDIADSQNALGQAIVDAQNALGQGIVDAQNALGQGIVDSQNALGQDIVDTSNYITKQHNVLSEWLHDNLCIIYKALNGNCARAIGPLQENQAHIPMQLYWAEGQLNIMEKIDQIQTTLPLALQDNLALEDVENANVSGDGGLNTIKGKMDTLSNYVKENVNQMDAVESKVDALSNDMQDKVDAVDSKINAVESKVDAVQDELRELKDMMAKMMGMMMN